MSNNNPKLGRGLSVLLGEERRMNSRIQMTNIGKGFTVYQIAVSKIIAGIYHPRLKFDDHTLEELSESIKEYGIIQPIIVRRSDIENSKFEIIAGERRWLAAQRAGIHNVPVVITEADDLKSLEFAIVENVQRHDLNPLEEAQG